MSYDEPTRISAVYKTAAQPVRYSTVFPNEVRQSTIPITSTDNIRYSTISKAVEPVRQTMVVAAPQQQIAVAVQKPTVMTVQPQTVTVQAQPVQVQYQPQPLVQQQYVEVEKPVYYQATQLVEDTDRVEILQRELEKYRYNYDHMFSKARSVQEYSTRLREYDEEVRRLQAIILGKSREIEELKLTMIDPNELLNLKQLVQEKNQEIQQLKRSYLPYEERLREYGLLQQEIARLTQLLNDREREIVDLRNRTTGQIDTSYYDRQIAELNRLVRIKDFELDALRREQTIIEGPSVQKAYVESVAVAPSTTTYVTAAPAVQNYSRANVFDNSNIYTSQYVRGGINDSVRPLYSDTSRRNFYDDYKTRLYESNTLQGLDLYPGSSSYSNYNRRFKY